MVRVELCDNCHKMIREKELNTRIRVSDVMQSFAFCESCSRPVVRFLNQKGLSLLTYSGKTVQGETESE